MDPQTPGRRAGFWTAAAAAFALMATPVAALAQGSTAKSAPASKAAPPSASTSERISTTVTVMAIDPATRHVLVKTPAGETAMLKVSPEVRNLGQVKPGDKVNATYYRAVAYAVSPPGQPLPKDTDTVLAARAGKGELPAGVVANHIVVTGNVLGIDKANSKLKVVNAKGGEVHELNVATPEGKELLSKLKVGDQVTAYITEALLLSVDRG